MLYRHDEQIQNTLARTGLANNFNYYLALISQNYSFSFLAFVPFCDGIGSCGSGSLLLAVEA